MKVIFLMLILLWVHNLETSQSCFWLSLEASFIDRPDPMVNKSKNFSPGL